VNGFTKRRGVVVGFDYYGRYLADLVNEHSEHWSLQFFDAKRVGTLRAILAMRKADALISFGGPGPDAALIEAARRRNVPVVVIWAGTDVVLAREDPGLLEVIKQYRFVNVSDGPWLVDELRELGIHARYVPVTAVVTPKDPAPLPQRFRVVSHLPEPRRAFYGEKAVYAVARTFRDIPFTVVGHGGPNPVAPSNVEFLGRIGDMVTELDRSTVMLRLPEHDGKSMFVLEALARGRHVVWNYGFRGVYKARTIAQAIEQIQFLYDEHRAGRLKLNMDGYNFVREHFRRETLAKKFVGVLDEAVKTERQRPSVRTHRVAISGFNLFAAQVADALQDSKLDWEPKVLRVNGNLERLTSLVHLATADVWYSIGSPLSDRSFRLVARLLQKPLVLHWVGSDIRLLNDSAIARYCRKSWVHNVAEVDWTLEELRSFGIKASLAPLPPRLVPPDVPMPMPDRFTVLLYVPTSRGEFYGRREYERLFRAFAGKPVRFLIVGRGECLAPQGADVISLGWCTDLRSVYEQTSVLLRYTKHDGLSLMTLEALSCGRQVLWTQDFPFTKRVRSYADCEREINTLLDEHLQGGLKPQAEAARFVRETYDIQSCIARIADVWEKAARPHGPVAYGTAEVRP
jgi:glycosyltransferase involved in cell wall biosynthesis